ncbi:MAG: hypothetical protein IJC43_01315 [Clostridia bacterium]|nr:hypothetical protein [Clostridia bacterium]
MKTRFPLILVLLILALLLTGCRGSTPGEGLTDWAAGLTAEQLLSARLSRGDGERMIQWELPEEERAALLLLAELRPSESHPVEPERIGHDS